ncbi:hypothetical protein [Desulfarculus baarsii]
MEQNDQRARAEAMVDARLALYKHAGVLRWSTASAWPPIRWRAEGVRQQMVERDNDQARPGALKRFPVAPRVLA